MSSHDVALSKVCCSYNPSYHDNGCIKVEIVFETDRDFSTILNPYYANIAISDPDAYEKYWEGNPLSDLDLIKEGEYTHFKARDPSPYDLGLMKRVTVLGLDKLEKDGSTYTYKEYVSDNYITRAVLVQLAEVKNKMDDGEADVNFRSGDLLDDLLGAIETLDRFWD